jgi:hypothetical protein
VEASRPAILPPRSKMDVATSLARVTPRHKVGVATMLLVAAVLAAAIDLAIPRASVAVQGATYSAPGCVASAASQTVIATFQLVNRGAVDGPITVSLLVDRNPAASVDYVVPAHGSLQGQIQTTLRDCSSHVFDLSLRYPDYAYGG